jgi:hypothetical protein
MAVNKVTRDSIPGPISLREVAAIFATGYVRWLAQLAALPSAQSPGSPGQIPVDSRREQSDELGRQRGNRRRPCNPA